MEAGEFEGRIGRYHWESEAWWPPEPRPPAGAPNVLLVVLDDVGYAQLGCFGSDIDTPNLDRLAAERAALLVLPHHRAVLADPGLRADRAQPPPRRHGSHHRPGHRVPRLRRPHPAARARCCRRCSRPHGYAAYAVGKWHLTPEDEEHLGARRDRWPLGRGFERWYGFFGGETHQFVPALVHDNHHVEPPAARRRRLPPHRPTSSTTPSSASRTCATSTSTSRGSSTSRPAPATRRTTRRPSGSSATAATSTAGGTSGGTTRWPGRRRWACCPSTPSCRRDPTGCRRGTTSVRRRAARLRPLHGGVRRLPLPHRPRDRPAGRPPRRRWASSTTRS